MSPRKLGLRNGRAVAATCALALALGPLSAVAQPTPPKVPFSNQPCNSLSETDEASLKIPTPVKAKPDRAPATLPFDNICTYTHGGTREAQVGYQTAIDYDANSSGNRSTSRKAPSDLPGAFYDKQGGLWFATKGYYVVVSGRSALREPVARLIVKKL
jgi:hypothetical protein